MKKILLLFILISGIVNAQTKYIMQKDFVPNGKNASNDLVKVDKMIVTLDGENKNVNTKLFVNKYKTDKQDAAFFNNMIDILLTEAKFTLKNKTSFSVQEIKIYKIGENKWLASTSYSGANSYGGKKDAEYSLNFDDGLKYTVNYISPEL